MYNYKIKEEAVEVWGNSGGGNIEKEKLFSNSRELINDFIILLSDINSLTKNRFGFYICSFKYIDIPAKSWRIDFGNKPNTLDDVKQRGVYTYFEDNQYYTNLFYKLSDDNVMWVKEKLNEIINAVNFSDISDDTYKNFLKKILTFGSVRNNNNPNLRIKRIKQTIEIENFSDIRIVRLLPFPEIINYLLAENILNTNNYDSDLMIAYLTYDEIFAINSMGFNIFYSTSNFPEYQIEATDLDDIISPLEINGEPNNEIIGIIDSGNNLDGMFTSYIDGNEDHREYNNYHQYSHGSSVASLIIANDEMNQTSKDNLGNFKIRHFELLEPQDQRQNSEGLASASFMHIMKKLPEIVRANRDIKVWNLSFGSIKNPYSRMVSDEGKMLDKLSKELNIIFVVASGNERNSLGMYSLNAPGDSLNSLTVGSSKTDGTNVTFSNYSSIGPILHFEKPEISHFGGPFNKDGSDLVMYSPTFSIGKSGTSFSTPRVSRLIAYFISQGLTPSEAKAKVISLAVKETPSKRSSAFGHIDYVYPKIFLNLEPTIDTKDPRYIPIKIPQETELIKISLVNQVTPRPMFGEEYSIQNFHGSIIVYDSSRTNPENDYVGLISKNLNSISNKYSQEAYLRFESGKYFNSSVYTTTIEKINDIKQRLISDNGCIDENIKVAIRIKKLDLFETHQDQPENVSMIASFYGDGINIERFESENISIISAEAEIDV